MQRAAHDAGKPVGGYTFPLVLLQQLASRKQQGSLHGSDAPDTIMRHSCRSDLLHSTACMTCNRHFLVLGCRVLQTSRLQVLWFRGLEGFNVLALRFGGIAVPIVSGMSKRDEPEIAALPCRHQLINLSVCLLLSPYKYIYVIIYIYYVPYIGI